MGFTINRTTAGGPTRILPKLLLLAVFFCGFLAFFYFSSPWYPAATLSVSGTIANNSSRIEIWWDSGAGLNGYEWARFPLQPREVAEDSETTLTITRTGEHHPAAAGKHVVLRTLKIDQKRLLVDPEDLPSGIERRGDELHFLEDGARLELKINPQYSLELEFPAFNRAGKVDVKIGDSITRYDLYSSNEQYQWGGRRARMVKVWFVAEDGRFTIHMPMPRYHVGTVRIAAKAPFSVTSANITTEDGRTIGLNGFEYRRGFNYPMSKIRPQLKNYYHPERFIFQVVFALISAWILSSLLFYAGRFHGIRDLFINDRRYLFWGMLIGSMGVFSFWHLSFWPAITSNDSLEIWRAALIPGIYLGDHPPLNVLFYLYLSQFWNNVAVVPIVQNFLTSLLIAYIYFSLYRRGLLLPLLLTLYLLTVLSIPIGLYTVILWKDVPFALLVVLLGFKLALYCRRSRNGQRSLSKSEWAGLICLTLILAGLRHNGVLYVFIVPFLILMFGIVRIRPVVVVVSFLVIVLVGGFFFVSGSSTSRYLTNQTRAYLDQAMDRASFDYLKKSGQSYFGIFDVHQTTMQWDLVHLCANGRYTYNFLRHLRWNDVYPYIRYPDNAIMKGMQETAWNLYWKSYEKPWVYFSWNPVFMLVLFLLTPLFFRKVPMAALFSLYIILPVGALVFLNILNWRYYYFAYLASYFLIPLILTDSIATRKRDVSNA